MKRDYRDIVAGGLVLAFGVFFAVYAATHYELGSMRRMGAGAYPLGVGVVLAVLGALILLPAFFRSGDFTRLPVRPILAVIGGLIVFALLVRSLGMVPAIVGLVVVSSLAEARPSPRAILGVSVVVSLLVYAIFRLALNLPFAMFRWPF